MIYTSILTYLVIGIIYSTIIMQVLIKIENDENTETIVFNDLESDINPTLFLITLYIIFTLTWGKLLYNYFNNPN